MSPHRLLVALLALALTVLACGSATPTASTSPVPSTPGPGARCATVPQPTSNEGWGAPVTPLTVIPYIISTRYVCGQVRFVFSFLDGENRPISAPDRTATVGFYNLGRSLEVPIATVEATFAWAIEGDRGIYIANVELPEAGVWGAEFTTEAPGSPKQSIRVGFDVHDDGPTVTVGEPAPVVKTPTLADVGGDVSRVSTDTDPDPEFYTTSVDEALAAGKPFILVFATPKFCQTAQCGPTLEQLKPIAAAHPDVTFINVEPYQLQEVDGQLQPVLDANGALQPVAATDTYGLLSEPWIFAVDADGIVRGSYALLATEAELDAVIGEIAPGA